MSTQTLIRKLNKEVIDMRKDLSEMKRVLIAATSDPEGEYKASFAQKIIARTQEKATYRFKGKADFLKQIHDGKK